MNVTFSYDEDDTVCINLQTIRNEINSLIEQKPIIDNLNVYIESDYKLIPLERVNLEYYSYNKLHYNIGEIKLCNDSFCLNNVLFRAIGISEYTSGNGFSFRIKVEYINRVYPLKNNYISKTIYMKDRKNNQSELDNIKQQKTRIYTDNAILLSNLQPNRMAIRTLKQSIRYINIKDTGVHTEYYTNILKNLILKDENEIY